MASTRLAPPAGSPLSKVFDNTTGIFLDLHEAANVAALQAASTAGPVNQGSVVAFQTAQLISQGSVAFQTAQLIGQGSLAPQAPGLIGQGSLSNPSGSTNGLGAGLASLINSNGNNGSDWIVRNLGSGSVPPNGSTGDASDAGPSSLINWEGKFRGLIASNLRSLR